MTYEELDDKIKNLLDSTESKVGDLIDDYNDFESDNNENPILIEKRGLWNEFDTLKSNIEMMLENSCFVSNTDED